MRRFFAAALLTLVALGLAAITGRAAGPMIPGDVAPGTLDGSTSPPTWRPAPDGVITVSDAIVLMRAAVGLHQVVPSGPAPGCTWLPGDLAPGDMVTATTPATWVARGNGVIDISDVTCALRASVHLQELAPLPDRQGSQLAGFGGCDALLAWLRDDALISFDRDGGWYRGWWWGPPGVPAPGGVPTTGAPGTPTAEAGSGSAAGSASSTNVQVPGVDEADVVKNDGTFILALSGDRLEIVRAFPAETLSRVATVHVEGWPQGLYFVDRRAIVLSQIWGQPVPMSGMAMPSWAPDFGLTKITVLDLADPAAPRLVRETYVDGWLQTSRMIGHRLNLVFYHALHGPALPEWTGDETSWRDAVRAALASSRLGDWMPFVEDVQLGADGGWQRTRRMLLDCGRVFHPDTHCDSGLVSVVTVDPFAGSPFEGTAVTGTATTAYASQRTLYVTGEQWTPDGPATRIWAFAIGADRKVPVYEGVGRVRGSIAGPFSLDEHDGYLRVAKTERDAATWTPSNGVVVLQPNGTGDLVVAGAVGGLAPGETIQSARFLGDRGFLCTFERHDPLFALDLTDPHRPRVAGLLETSGFSSYLHPLGPGGEHLLGIGAEADASGMVTGMQLSLFDVTDIARPALSDRESISTGWSAWTDAMWDHHAFQFFEPASTLAIPFVHVDDWDPATGAYLRGFNGLVAYRVTVAGGIQPAGRLSIAPVGGEDPSSDPWCDQVRRAVFMNDRLYAVSTAGIVVAPLAHLETPIASVRFPEWMDCGGGGVVVGGGTEPGGSGGSSSGGSGGGTPAP